MAVILSILPIILLFVLMLGFKMAGHKSAFITLVVTAIIALFARQAGITTPDYFRQSAVGWAFIEGVLKAIFPILIIILMAIFSYNVLVESKKIEVIKSQFTTFTDDKGIMVLMLVWGFGGLLEGMAGFGTAVAIPAAILISLGFKPMFSALVALIANTVATGFGAVGVPVITLCKEALGSDVSQEAICDIAAKAVIQLSPLFFILPFIILMLTDHSKKALLKNVLLSIWVGAISVAVQYIVAKYLGAETPAILGSVAAIVAIIIYAKLFTPKREKRANEKSFSAYETFQAWSVYLFILVFILISGPMVPPIREFLTTHLVTKLQLPEIGTTFSFGWISNAGLMLFLGTVIGGLIQGVSFKRLMVLLAKTTVNLNKTMVTIISLVSLASIMNHAGMITEIANALAGATGGLYPLFAPLIGAIGTFVTGSDTSSNILFAKLQANVGAQMGFPLGSGESNWLVAANTTGATGGKMISPQSIAIATASCDMQGKDGEIMKSAIPYALLYIIIGGLMVYFGM